MISRFTRRATLVGLLAALPSPAAEPQAPPPREAPPSLEQRAARHLERIRQDGAALRAFLRAFPKGADLHTHLTGAVYAETGQRDCPSRAGMSRASALPRRSSRTPCSTGTSWMLSPCVTGTWLVAPATTSFSTPS
jgi:hypothetical protein